MEWLSLLIDALQREYGDSPRMCILGTSDTDCVPHLRTVVIRSLDARGCIVIASDARSKKNEQVKENPAAAVAVWLPREQMQFRIEGTVDVIGWATADQSFRHELWEQLSDATRAMFFWPESGKDRTMMSAAEAAARFPKSKPAGEPMPESFELICIHPRMAERLLLTEHPHHRTCWKGPAWAGEEINP